MNNKVFTMTLGAAVLGGGLWLGYKVWGPHDKVTLHVRNTPMAEVVRSIEKQTGQRIRVDKKLDATVTLNVKSVPLTNVLDQLAEQVGARWGRTYAVYGNELALRRLEGVLRGESDLETAGWTNLAPRFDASDLSAMPHLAELTKGAPGGDGNGGGGGAGASGSGPRRIVVGGPPGDLPADGGGTVVTEDIEKIVGDAIKGGATVTRDGDGGRQMVRMMKGGPGEGHDFPGGAGGGSRTVVVRRSSGAGGTTTTITDGDGRVKVTKTSADGKVVASDDWSAARLVLETPLSPKLGAMLPKEATMQSAVETAEKVHGRAAVYYALEKPPIGGDFGGMARTALRNSVQLGGTNNPMASSNIRDRIEAEGRARKLEDLSKGPEEQVRRARQAQEAQAPK